MKFLILFLTLSISVESFAKEDIKGVLPELKINSLNEDDNQKKALKSELMITKSENQAINSLISVLKKRKGSAEEADLWYRLAELYMRRSKSGRFFDLNRTSNDGIKFTPTEVADETAAASLKRAVQIYTKIEKDYPTFKEMDSVLFNNAFASQQLRLKRDAEPIYKKLIAQYPKSPLIPDTLLALGEMKYEGQKFDEALEFFEKIEKYPLSRVFSYGLYKSAWTLYNLKRNDPAINKLVLVVKYNNPNGKTKNANQVNHNLRNEALRDLALFFGETKPAEEAYAFFSSISTKDETAEAMLNLAKLYDSHSRNKELILFLADFIKKDSQSPYRVKAHLMIVNSLETLKQRKEVVEQLKATAKVCETSSEWVTQNGSTYEESCRDLFATTNIEIARKWWDIWLKNKHSKEIADLTQQAFKIHLDRDDPLKPDIKSRYAYAELLFQLDQFKVASEQYENVADKTDDATLRHDADYGALFCYEKISEKNKDKKLSDEDEAVLLRLSQKYISRNPAGKYLTSVKFKVGFIAYENNQTEEAEKWLKPIAADAKSGEFKRKSEDLILDIYNSRKDYKSIKSFADELAKNSMDLDRKRFLTKIKQEAGYNEIQEAGKTGEKVATANKCIEFYNENPDSPLAQKSLWQALSLFFSAGKTIDAAEVALIYNQKYPTDKNNVDALKDAAQTFTNNGQFLKAINVFEMLVDKDEKNAAKYKMAMSDLYLLENNKMMARKTLEKLITDNNPKEHSNIYLQILNTMKGEENSAEYKSYESKILAQNIEPFSSKIKLKQVESLYSRGKFTEAFNASKNLVGSDRADEETKALARVIQAQVLEKEFVGQSTKSSLEKLNIVLSLKLEKLDKVQTAYLSAVKISKNPNVQLKALQGLQRVYANYIETVGNPPLKEALSPADTEALKTELGKLTGPIENKKKDIDEKLIKLAKDTKATGTFVEVDYANLSVDESIKAKIKDINTKNLAPYLPIFNAKSENGLFKRFVANTKGDKCEVPRTKTEDLTILSELLNKCISLKQTDKSEEIIYQMAKLDPKNPISNYYLSIVAELQGKTDKSVWLIDQALKKSEDYVFLFYQKGRVLAQTKDLAGANTHFIKAYDYKLETEEVKLMHGVVSYAQGDCYSVVDDFAKLDSKTISTHNLGPAYGECLAQKGDTDQAEKVLKKQIELTKGNVDLYIEQAYIKETYKSDKTLALPHYEAAVTFAQDPELKDWLIRKINWIKNPNQVTVLQQQHVIAEDSEHRGSK